jgi:hypothetical protein
LCGIRKKKANAQIAHLVFADTQADAEKPKELFFSQRSTKKVDNLNEICNLKGLIKG